MATVYNKSVRYAYTITLLPKLYKLKPEEQYDKTYIEVVKTLKALNSTICTVAELTKNYNIHYHGVLQYSFCDKKEDLMKKFYDIFRGHDKFGYVNIKQITDEPKWLEYMSKEIEGTECQINRKPIIIDEFDYYKKGMEEYISEDLISEQ